MVIDKHPRRLAPSHTVTQRMMPLERDVINDVGAPSRRRRARFRHAAQRFWALFKSIFIPTLLPQPGHENTIGNARLSPPFPQRSNTRFFFFKPPPPKRRWKSNEFRTLYYTRYAFRAFLYLLAGRGASLMVGRSAAKLHRSKETFVSNTGQRLEQQW